MRLLIVTQAVDLDDPILGFFHRWIEEFAKHTEKVSVICLREGTHNLPRNVSVYSLGKESGVSRLKYIRNFYRYLWVLRNEYDAVFVHMNPEYVVLGGLIWRLTGKKIALWFTHRSVTWYLRMAVLLANTVFTASAQSFPISTEKRKIMGHGIPVEDYATREVRNDLKLRICTVGRISRTKHIQEMIEAVLEISNRGIDCAFTIVGSGATERERVYEKELRERYAHESAVLFQGTMRNVQVASFLGTQDLFINASDTGGLDKAILEAMAAGIGVISSNKAARPILEPYGLYVSEPSSAEFSRAIATYRARSDRESLSQTLQAYVVEHHSLERLIPSILQAL